MRKNVKKMILFVFVVTLGFSVLNSIEYINLKDILENNEFVIEEMYQIIEDNHLYTEIEFSLPKSEFIVNKVSDEYYLRIFHPEANYIMEEGYPELPIFSTMIAIPNKGEVYLEELSKDNVKILSESEPFPSQGFDIEICEDRGFIKNEQFYDNGDRYPQQSVVLGSPAIMRDFRVVPVTFQPFSYDPVRRELVIKENIRIRINYDISRSGENEITQNRLLSRSFENIYRSSILNFDSVMNNRNPEYQQRSIIVIYPNTTNSQYLTVVNDFTDWKRRKGFHVVSTSTAGMTTNNAIKNYIQNAYDTWENPPEYVVLMGANSGSFSIPSWSMGSPAGAGDHNYTTLAGGDILGDIFIGRFPATSAVQLQTMWNKQLGYEKYPYMANTDWYERGVLTASESTSSGISIVFLTRYIRDQMLAHNPDYDVVVINSGEVYSQTVTQFNQGVMTFAFRGFMMSGWNPSQTNNGYMLPHCFMITCYTYAQAEETIRAGTPATPRGGISTVGMSTGSTKTAFNNILLGGFYYGMYVDGARTMGETVHLGKLHMHTAYANIHYSQMTNFFHWTNLFGDPSMDIWLGVPKEMNVDYDNQVLYGQNYIDVTVTDAFDNPVENAWVTIRRVHQGNEVLFVSGYTDSSGMITLYHNPVDGEIDITVTKPDYHPYLGEITVSDEGIVAYEGIIFNTELDAGSTSEFIVILKNYTDQTVTGISGQLSTNSDYIEIINGDSDFADMAPDAVGQGLDVFSVSVSQSAPDFYQVVFDLNLTDGINDWSTRFNANINGSSIEIAEILFGSNEVINPGQTANMNITLHNSGSIDLENIYAELFTVHELFEINDSLTYFGTIPAGGNASSIEQFINVTALAQLLPGMKVPLHLNIYNDEGYENTIYFNQSIGVQTVTDPLGPDSYGYWCYDDGDIDYIDAPVYDWFEIDPTLGGPGENTGITADFHNNQGYATMDLPFTFRFYGVDYDEITICANGWVSFGEVDYGTQRNWHLPGPLGPHPIIAAFWDNLSLSNGGIYTYYDVNDNSFIIQWSNTQNIVGNQENTFQVILYDPMFHPIFQGNGPIKIQYKVFNNVNNAGASPHGNWGKYATVGIADHTNTVGLQYTFNNIYPDAAKVLENETAIYFTGPPVSYDDDFLILNQVNIFDDNNYGFVYPGEMFSLNIVAMNYGQSSSENIIGTISSDSEFVEIYTSDSPFVDIPSGLTGMNTEFFTFSVSENVPDGVLLPFDLNLSSSTGSWGYNFNLSVKKPSLELKSFIINDSEGNNDGVADPGEDVKLIFNIHNPSEMPAEDIQVNLASQSTYITIENPVINITRLPSGKSLQAVFNVSVSSTAPAGSGITFDVTISSEGISDINNTISLGISVSPEILEENFDTWLPDGWSIDAYAGNWSQSSTSNAGGTSPEARLSFSPSFIGISRLISNPITLMGATNVSLEFKHHVNNFSGGYTLGVATRSNYGDWTTIWDINVSGDVGAETIIVPIDNSDLHNPNFQVCWYLEGDSWGLNYWYIDDIIIHATMGNSAVINGNVNLETTGYNVQDVIVTTDFYGVNPNESGDYTLYVNAGEYSMLEAWLPYHDNPFYEDLELGLGEVLEGYDFTLNYLTPPENLTAQYLGTSVNLSWDFDLPERNVRRVNGRDVHYRQEFQHFKVYRQHFTGLFELITATTQNFFTDNINNNDRYSYYIVAVYTEGESIASNTVTVPPEGTEYLPPQNLTAQTGDGFVYLTWDPPSLYYQRFFYMEEKTPESVKKSITKINRSREINNLENTIVQNRSEKRSETRTLLGYNIYRNGTMVNSELIEDLEFMDETIVNNTIYNYHVTAVYTDGESPGSELVEAIPLSAPFDLDAVVIILARDGESATVELFWNINIPHNHRSSRSGSRETVELTGFDIYRDDELIGHSSSEELYYLDESPGVAEFVYHVVARYGDLESDPSNSVIVDVPVSTEGNEIALFLTELKGNYPNPFNPDTRIDFSLAETGYVEIVIYNILGQRVRSLLDSNLEEGNHKVIWNGMDDYGKQVGSGIYFYRMRTNDYTAIKKMIMLK